MGRTLTNIRQSTVEELMLPVIAATSDGSASTTTLIDRYVLDKYPNDALIGLHIYLTAEDLSAWDLLITDSVQATYTATFQPTNSAAPDSKAYEILPFSVGAMHAAIDYAIDLSYTRGWLGRMVEMHSVTGSPVYNADWSYWTSASQAHGWAGTSNMSRLQSEADKWVGHNTLRLSSNGYIQLDDEWRRFLLDTTIGGSGVDFWCWVRTSTASNARIAIIDQNGTVTYSTYHTGDGDWEAIKTHIDIDDLDTAWNIRLYRDNSANADFSLCWIEGGSFPSEIPLPVPPMPLGPSSIRVRSPHSASMWRPADNAVHFTSHDEGLDVSHSTLEWTLRRPATPLDMQIRGFGPLSIPTSNTDVIEVDRREARLLAKLAAQRLIDVELPHSVLSKRRNWQEVSLRLEGEIQDIAARGRNSEADAVALGANW